MENKTELTEWQKVKYTQVFVSIFYNNSFTKEKSANEPSLCKTIVLTVYRICTSHIGLVLILLLYSFTGAAIFQAVEGKQKGLSDNEKLNQFRSEAISEIMRELNVTEDSHAEDDLLKVFETYEKNLAAESLLSVHLPAEEVWDFWGSMFFCATAYTTIGYGDMFPVTKGGKWLTIVYSLFGIPLCLITIANLGILFTTLLTFLYKAVMRKCCCCKVCSPEASHKDSSIYQTNVDAENVVKIKEPADEAGNGEGRKERNFTDGNAMKEIGLEEGAEHSKAVINAAKKFKIRSKNNTNEDTNASHAKELSEAEGYREYNCCCTADLSALVPILITVIYMLFGVLMYSIWEDWDFTDAFYFLFISLSTIGFGDIVPTHRKFFLASGIYILFGLSLVAMTVSSLMHVTNSTLGKAKEKVDMLAEKGLGVEMTGSDSFQKSSA